MRAAPHDDFVAGPEWAQLPYGGFIDEIGPMLVREDDSGLRFGLRTQDRHLNGHGVVHGGVLMTFMDQALGMTGWRSHRRYRQATMQLSVSFVAGIRAGELLEAQCAVIRRGRSVMFLRASAFVGQNLVGTADGVWKLFTESDP